MPVRLIGDSKFTLGLIACMVVGPVMD